MGTGHNTSLENTRYRVWFGVRGWVCFFELLHLISWCPLNASILGITVSLYAHYVDLLVGLVENVVVLAHRRDLHLLIL